ncbi:MAG: hypothetical protein RL005_1570 [Planctomycetota bacterium]
MAPKDSAMRSNLLAGVSGVVVAVALAGSASAVTVDTNGGASWGGWTATGVSNELGTWASGATGGAVYRIYQTVFTFDNNAMSLGSGYAGNTFTGGPGFASGNLIYGLGIERVSGTGNLGTLTIGFDLGNDSYQAASSVGGTDGRVSTSSWSQYQDFNVQFGATTGASQYGVQQGNGSSYGGSSNFVNSGNSGGLTFAFRGAGNGLNYQMFFDISYMNANYTLAGAGSAPTIGTIGEFFRLSVDVGMGSAGAARTAVQSVQVPAPGAIALLGAAGLMGRRRRN